MEMISKKKLNSNLNLNYKNTPIGVIPLNWEIKNIGEMFKLKNGVNSEKENYGTGIKFINISEIINKNSLKYEDIPNYISLPAKIINNYLVKKGDVLFNRTSETQNEIGLASVYLDNLPVIFGGFVIRARALNSSINQNFSKYVFSASFIRKDFIKRGQGGIRANIGQGDLYKIQFFLPPLLEQKAIAAALTDVDDLISALDALIAKKRNIKQGAMQELLTGKRRLPGFKGKWELRKLGDMVDKIIGGGTPSRNIDTYWNGNIYWATVKDFSSFNPMRTQESITDAGLNQSSANLIKKGTVITSTRMAIGKAV